MADELLGVYANLLNVIGTIVAILCILKLNFRDLATAGSVIRVSHPELEVFIQRRFALKGISIIILGLILSVIDVFVEINWVYLLVIVVSSIIAIYLINIYFNIEHTVILQEFDKYMKENGKTSPLDKAINGEEIRNEKIPKWFKKRKYF